MKSLLAALFFSLLVLPMAQAQEVDDQDIVNRVRRAIDNSEEMNGADIFVISVNGYVLLAGQALSDNQKQRASVAVAFATSAMRRLINELEVVDVLDYSFNDSDQAILDQIVEVIPTMSPATVPVIHNGVVYLLGRVTREEGDEVAQAISRMSGVANIRLSYEYIQ